jgi:hypothetical protein
MIIVLIAINLITAGFTLAQSSGAATESAPQSTFDAVPVQQPSATNISQLETLTRSLALRSGRRTAVTSNTVLVIPSQEIKTEDILAINVDINVMSRIFDDKLNQVRFDRSNANWSFVGNRWRMTDSYGTYLGFGGNKTGCMYLQGYGALFLMNVDFPLSAPPEAEKQQEEKPKKENVDQVWEETRKQIYEPQETNRRVRGTERKEVKYDAEKVDNLKTTLIESLKHASNIRILKPDESVILSITGIGTASDDIVSMVAIPGTDQILVTQESGGKEITKVYKGGGADELNLSSPTVLVIRAKKADIDSFAKGGLNLDSFRQRVQILSYPLLSESVAGAGPAMVVPTTGEIFSR